MKNYIQSPEKIVFAAPAGGVEAGDPYMLQNLFGVVQGDAEEAEDAVLVTQGVFELPKATHATDQNWVQGETLYWDSSASNVTTTAAGNTAIGVAASAAVSTAAVGEVRING